MARPGMRLLGVVILGFAFAGPTTRGEDIVIENPRLDCICLCDDPGYVPTDEDAKAGLKQGIARKSVGRRESQPGKEP